MREILFRGKATNRNQFYPYRTSYKNGDWVYGMIERLYDDKFPNVPATMRNTDGISDIDIDYTTVGQYTGKEVEGEKLFEGDIVETIEDYDDSFGYPATDYFYSVVVWDKENFCWAFDTGGYIQGFNDWTWGSTRKVGNIHDNPELLEGGL